MRRFGSLVTILTAVPLLAFGPGERVAGTHWALMIGISDYTNFDDVEGGDLPGAQFDAMGMRDVLLQKYDFPEANVRTLLNGQATRAAIQESITGWLTENARPGDNVVVFFAGHGSQMWDENGDEDDGLDETIAPADVSPNSTDFDISDDTFGEWLSALPTDNVVVLLDNCNSGTGTRDVTPFSRSRELGRDVNALSKPASAARRALPGQVDETGFDAGHSRVLELAAAQPHQAAVDAFFPGGDGEESFHGGAFTTFLVRQLWRAPADATYEEVFRDVHEALKRNRFQQDPHLSEDVSLKDMSLFFVEGAEPMEADAALPVVSSDGGTARLGGGQTLGITTGSVFEVGTARLVVETVEQTASTARVSRGAVSAGDRAKLIGYRYPSVPLRVNVAGLDSESADALTSAVSENQQVDLVREDGAFSHLLIRRRGTELRVVGSDGFLRHEGLPAGSAGAADLASILSAEAAAKQLADMENPAQPFGVELRLVDGRTSFGVGEEISFHVTSHRDGYLTLVDLGTDGTVAVLLPNGQAPSMQVKAGQEVSFPAADAGFALQALPPAGRGMVRAFVTPRPLEIRIPAGEDYATGGAELAGWIADQVRAAAGEIDEAVRLDSWATSSLVYDIHN